MIVLAWIYSASTIINGMKMFISMKWKNCVCIVSVVNNLTRSGVLSTSYSIQYLLLHIVIIFMQLEVTSLWAEMHIGTKNKCTKNNIQRKNFVEENWFLTYWPQLLEWCVVSSIDCLNFNRFSIRIIYRLPNETPLKHFSISATQKSSRFFLLNLHGWYISAEIRKAALRSELVRVLSVQLPLVRNKNLKAHQ